MTKPMDDTERGVVVRYLADHDLPADTDHIEAARKLAVVQWSVLGARLGKLYRETTNLFTKRSQS